MVALERGTGHVFKVKRGPPGYDFTVIDYINIVPRVYPYTNNRSSIDLPLKWGEFGRMFTIIGEGDESIPKLA